MLHRPDGFSTSKDYTIFRPHTTVQPDALFITMDIAPRAISILVVGPIVLLSWCANLILPAKTRTESHSRDISNKSIAVIFVVSIVITLSVVASLRILEYAGFRTLP